MAIIKVGTLNPHGAPVLRKAILANSITSVVNDSLKLASGFAALGTAGALVFGHLFNHKSKNDVGILSTGVSGAEMGSYVGSYLTAADNQTVGKVEAECDISTSSLYSAELDVAVGTTANSNLNGYNFDLVDEDTLDESTVVATTAQYHSHGIDPDNTAQVIVNIYESQVFGV
jgi:hypothetical protein